MNDMQPDMMNAGAHNAAAEAANDREGAMAKADLYKLANYSLKLFKKLQDEDQLEGWVQAKVTKAADYIASVYHYLEYEMKISEYGNHLDNAEVMSEGKRSELKNKLTEAKAKIAELKKLQAAKITGQQVNEGHQCTCEMCGGSGMVEKEIPEELKAKVRAYNKQAKAMHAASKRIDRNKNGIPDDEEVAEDQEELKKTGDSKKTRTGTLTKTDTGVIHKNTSYHDDGDEISSNAKSGKGIKSHAKSQSAAEKKAQAPKQKQSPKSAKTWGMKDSEKFDNRDKEVDETYGQGVYEGTGKKPDFLDMDKDGDKKEPMKKAVADKKENPFAKKDSKVDEELKGGQKKLDVDHDGDIEADDLADLRAKKDKKVDEATGDYSAKKGAAGKDLGKPGKNFAKIAKKAEAGGAKSGEAVAGAVLKKLRAKESVEPKAEVIAESTELNRMKEFLTRLNG
jgi:hypothetical protein